jgi:hypothetical protein
VQSIDRLVSRYLRNTHRERCCVGQKCTGLKVVLHIVPLGGYIFQYGVYGDRRLKHNLHVWRMLLQTSTSHKRSWARKHVLSGENCAKCHASGGRAGTLYASSAATWMHAPYTPCRRIPEGKRSLQLHRSSDSYMRFCQRSCQLGITHIGVVRLPWMDAHACMHTIIGTFAGMTSFSCVVHERMAHTNDQSISMIHSASRFLQGEREGHGWHYVTT